jgi:hypothetical protein
LTAFGSEAFESEDVVEVVVVGSCNQEGPLPGDINAAFGSWTDEESCRKQNNQAIGLRNDEHKR